jgi:hypothetical protein
MVDTMHDLHQLPYYYGEWGEYEKILILLAKRNGSIYEHYWHTDDWGNLLGSGPTRQICKCLICHSIIIDCDFPVDKYKMGSDIREHGMMHLKERPLLPFL